MPTAVLAPQTALLVPGVAGRAEVLGGVRDAALEVGRDALRGAERVVMIVPGAELRVVDATAVRATFGALSVPERALGWPAPAVAGGPRSSEASTAGAVGLRLLAAAGWHGSTEIVEAPIADVTVPVEVRSAVRGADVVLVLGSLSARHGEGAPLAADPRADDVDARLGVDLASPNPEALERLAQLDAQLCADLDIGGGGPWRLLARCVEGAVVGELVARDDSLGVTHAVWTWRWER